MSKVKFISSAAGISLALAFTFGCVGNTVKLDFNKGGY
jgi:hypothetical protein